MCQLPHQTEMTSTFLCLVQFREMLVKEPCILFQTFPVGVIDSYHKWASPLRIKQTLPYFASSVMPCMCSSSHCYTISDFQHLYHPLQKIFDIWGISLWKQRLLVPWVLGVPQVPDLLWVSWAYVFILEDLHVLNYYCHHHCLIQHHLYLLYYQWESTTTYVCFPPPIIAYDDYHHPEKHGVLQYHGISFLSLSLRYLRNIKFHSQ